MNGEKGIGYSYGDDTTQPSGELDKVEMTFESSGANTATPLSPPLKEGGLRVVR